jgi:Tfp pilus assembly protein PilO
MKDILARIPFSLFLVIYLATLGYGVYEFHFGSDGQGESNRGRLTAMQNEVTGLKKKLEEGKKFVESLEIKKQEIRKQVKQLEEYQVSFSENLDVPALIKMMIQESKRVGVRIDRMEPGIKKPQKYYLEQEFRVDLNGTFVQVVNFFKRVSQLQRILRVEAFTMRPQSDAGSTYGNLLEVKLSLRAYQYVVSNEDSLAKGVK